MTEIDHEFEYNNRKRIPEHREIIARWLAASAAGRQAARADLDQPYGPGERQRYDLFHAGEPSAPLVVAIHGGYWQMGSRQELGFLAQAFNAAGIAIAFPSYSLCPAVSVMQIFTIVDELARPDSALFRRVVSLVRS